MTEASPQVVPPLEYVKRYLLIAISANESDILHVQEKISLLQSRRDFFGNADGITEETRANFIETRKRYAKNVEERNQKLMDGLGEIMRMEIMMGMLPQMEESKSEERL
jgi:hypothetical protein